MPTNMVLDMHAVQKDFFEESAIIGLGTALPMYRLCSLLNRLFEVELACDPEMTIELNFKNKPSVFFPVYQCWLYNSEQQYLIYKNKMNNAVLVPEIKSVDYLWLVQSSSPHKDALAILEQIRTLPDIDMCKILKTTELKSLMNILI